MSDPAKKKKVTLSPRDMLYQNVFKSPQGERLLKDLKTTLQHGETLFHPGKSDGDLHFALGRQSVINDIMYILNKEAN